MNTIHQNSHQCRTICVRTLITLFTIAILGCSQEILAQQWTTTGSDISNTNSGNVGVGITTPDANAKLHVFKALGSGVDIQSSTAGGWARLRLATGTRTYGWFAGDAGNSDAPNKIGLYDYNAFAFRMMVDSAGNVGIGTSSPQSLLDVSGPAGVTLRTGASSAGFSIFDRPSVPGDQLVFQGNAGNYSVFNVATKNATISSPRISAIALWTVDNAISGDATQLQLQNSPSYGGVLFTQKFGTGAQGDKKISLQSIWNQTSVPAQLVLDTNGSVGVGTGTPDSAYKLDVVGNVRVSGNIAAKYQDVAEWVEASQPLPAATVVVLNSNKSNHVVASSRAYDTRVAGVISSQPGLILGERAENKVLVATTGRVKIKADAAHGAIRVGDLLVTSNKEGIAMKSRPISVGGARIHRPGTIIGKALEPLAKGQGEILVLLSLQ